MPAEPAVEDYPFDELAAAIVSQMYQQRAVASDPFHFDDEDVEVAVEVEDGRGQRVIRPDVAASPAEVAA